MAKSQGNTESFNKALLKALNSRREDGFAIQVQTHEFNGIDGLIEKLGVSDEIKNKMHYVFIVDLDGVFEEPSKHALFYNSQLEFDDGRPNVSYTINDSDSISFLKGNAKESSVIEYDSSLLKLKIPILTNTHEKSNRLLKKISENPNPYNSTGEELKIYLTEELKIPKDSNIIKLFELNREIYNVMEEGKEENDEVFILETKNTILNSFVDYLVLATAIKDTDPRDITPKGESVFETYLTLKKAR